MEGFDDLVDEKPRDVLPSRVELARLAGTSDEKAVGIVRVLLARCRPGAPIEDQLIAIEQLGRFIVAGPAVPTDGDRGARAARVAGRRARAACPAAQRRFQATLGAVLAARAASSCSARSACPTIAACSPRPPIGSRGGSCPRRRGRTSCGGSRASIIRKLDDLDVARPRRRSAAAPARRSPAATPGSRCARRSSTRSACSPRGSPRSA